MLVEKRMSRNPETITPDDDLAAAQAKLRKGGFRRLPVVKDEKLVGILTEQGPARAPRLGV
jgi:acetoin utilization protein AcuB